MIIAFGLMLFGIPLIYCGYKHLDDTKDKIVTHLSLSQSVITTGGLIMAGVAMLIGLFAYFNLNAPGLSDPQRQLVVVGTGYSSYIAGILGFRHSVNKQLKDGKLK